MVAIIVPLATDSRASRPSANARRYAPGKPEHGKATGFSEKRKAQVGCEEICGANRNGKPDRANPRWYLVGATSPPNFLD
jgi:hypothetical protein